MLTSIYLTDYFNSQNVWTYSIYTADFGWEQLGRKQQLPDFTKAGDSDSEIPTVSVTRHVYMHLYCIELLII